MKHQNYMYNLFINIYNKCRCKLANLHASKMKMLKQETLQKYIQQLQAKLNQMQLHVILGALVTIICFASFIFSSNISMAQSFSPSTTNPYSLRNIGAYSSPTFVDLDNDGDLDVISSVSNGSFNYFQNIGASTAPYYDHSTNNPYGLSSTVGYSNPTFADLDNDGDLDLISGDFNGDFDYFQNIGTATAPAFAPSVINPYGLRRILIRTTPSFVDLDNDGDLDLISGNSSGNFYYFQNKGTSTVPLFDTLINNPFGLSNIGSRSAPTFTDLDNDGDFDMVSGSNLGNYCYFQNTGTAVTPSFAPFINNPFGLSNVGNFSTPNFADLDKDGDIDIISGEQSGNFFYFQNSCSAAALGSISSISGPASICSGGSNTYSISSVSGASSYVWVLPNTWTGSSVSTSNTVIASNNSGFVKALAVLGCRARCAQKLISVLPTSTGTINATICSNQTFLFNGIDLNSTGSYLDTIISVNGCDSVVTLNLEVNPISTGTIDDTICAGTSYTFNDMNRTISGSYLDTLVNIVGCDSILTLNLVVRNCGSSLPAGADDICRPFNISSSITLSTPYAASGYANINTHSDTILQNNLSATFISDEPTGYCGLVGPMIKTTWTKFVAPQCATPQIIISTDDRNTTNFDTRITAFRKVLFLSCLAGYLDIACSDNDAHPSNTGATYNSTILLSPSSGTYASNEYEPGETIYIQTSGVESASGDYGLIIDLEPYVPITTIVGSGSAVIDWSAVSSMGAITGTYIQWRPVGSGPTVSGTFKYVSGSTTTTITGLTPGVTYEYWASYVCTSGGRWWSKKGTFTTNVVCTGGTTPSIVSVVAGSPSCNKPVVSFDAPSLVYSSYKVARRKVGTSTISYSSTFYPSASTQTWTNSSLVLGTSYEYWIIGYCGSTSAIISPITTYTVCAVLRQANPDATTQIDADKDVVYIMPNGDVVYGLPINQLPIELDMTNTGEQEITLQTIDANNYFGREIINETAVTKVGEVSIYPNPATNEATISYSLEKETAMVEIQILDAQGKEMIKEVISNPAMNGTYNINLNNYYSGIYFVKIQAGEFTEMKKLIVGKN